MGLSGILLQQVLLGATILASIAAAEPTNSSCIRTCGSLQIPYPFGTTEGCYLDPSFLITCNNSTPFLSPSNLTVLNISLDGEIRVSSSIARDCPNEPGYNASESVYEFPTLKYFLISSTKNKFTGVGCDTVAAIEGMLAEENYVTGCLSLCKRIESVRSGSCNGIGCCQTYITQGMRSFAMALISINNHSEVSNFNPCGYSFVTEEGAYNFSSSDLANLRNRETFPVVLDWAVGNETCQDAKKNLISYAYINECETSKPCNMTCTNTMGSFICHCPKGYEGDGMKNGTGCRPIATHYRSIAIELGIGIGLSLLLLGGFSIYWGLKRRKLIKLKEKVFQQNGGLMLQQQLSNHIDSPTKIFSIEELKRATNNYNELKEDRLLQILDNHIVNDDNIEDLREVANLVKRCLTVSGEDRPSMKEVAMELEGLRITKKRQREKANLYTEETEYLLTEPTHYFSIDVGTGSSSNNTATGYDSIRNHLLQPPDDGR
ncbi:hypothetical protein FH972_019673 [Carpinus fangiana]|uniref:EGF-like domain-containing protein n=1 Tax=Carpinus fangiana TaxID=176857 RepID=A0A5N6RR68_9ROSI|nr:hypothetical protein FH972_019673 [Carpinus fangiana]